VRVAPWRTGTWGDAPPVADPREQRERAVLLAPIVERGVLSTRELERCLTSLRDNGYDVALTAALGPNDQRPFLDLGFEVHERLHLLAHGLRDIPEVARDAHAASIRRARRRDRGDVLRVDHRAFPAFWQLDDEGLLEALAATPSNRFRVAVDPAGEVSGYAVWGRAGPRGYLQRLAVDPDVQGRGAGTSLIADGLTWLRKRGASRAFVNTQEANERALLLYERTGFRRQRDGLAVLRLAL
jgi:ribosomal protein S18 acetylase RimI-like enzyme